jgi:hypothetical protein
MSQMATVGITTGSAIDSTVGPANAVEITPTMQAPHDVSCDALNELDNLLGL